MNVHDHGGLPWPGADERTAAMAERQSLPRKAGVLRRLHHGPDLLVLPNAWDAGTARICAAAGFPAVATSSVGVVESLGYPDDDVAPPDEVFAVLARTAAAVDVPLTADLEAGYGLSADELAARVLAAGAVGLNLEDSDHTAGGLRDIDEQAARLGAVKAAGRRLGVDLVLNARIDVHLAAIGDPGGRLEHAVERARRYVAAGADCVYPIGLEDLDDLAAFVAAVRSPVNAMLRPGGPSLDELRAVGARRVSTAAVLYRTTMAALRDSAEALAAAAYPGAASGSG